MLEKKQWIELLLLVVTNSSIITYGLDCGGVAERLEAHSIDSGARFVLERGAC